MSKKLSLLELKISSFVTSKDSTDFNTVKGGKAPQSNKGCDDDGVGPDEPSEFTMWCTGGNNCKTGHLCYISVTS